MLTTVRPTTRRSVLDRVRPWWLWIVTAFAFPPAGFLGHALAGPVDAPGVAMLSGLVAGTVIGAVQWVVLRRRGASPRWIAATAVGFGVGLAAGAALVGHATSLAGLVVMGAVCGAVLGLAQVASFAPLRRHALTWTLATAALWAIGWAVTSGAGIQVEDQWPVFGISGALTVAILQSVVVNRLVPARSTREVMSNG